MLISGERVKACTREIGSSGVNPLSVKLPDANERCTEKNIGDNRTHAMPSSMARDRFVSGRLSTVD